MTDRIREAFDAWLKTLDKARDDNGLMPLTSREVDILRNGYSVGWKAALAQQPAPAVPTGWKLVPVEPAKE